MLTAAAGSLTPRRSVPVGRAAGRTGRSARGRRSCGRRSPSRGRTPAGSTNGNGVPPELPMAVGEQVREVVGRLDRESVQRGRRVDGRTPIDDLHRGEVDRHDPCRDRLGERQVGRAVLAHLGDEEVEPCRRHPCRPTTARTSAWLAWVWSGKRYSSGVGEVAALQQREARAVLHQPGVVGERRRRRSGRGCRRPGRTTAPLPSGSANGALVVGAGQRRAVVEVAVEALRIGGRGAVRADGRWSVRAASPARRADEPAGRRRPRRRRRRSSRHRRRPARWARSPSPPRCRLLAPPLTVLVGGRS